MEEREAKILALEEENGILKELVAALTAKMRLLLATSEELLKIEADEQEGKKNVPIPPKSVKAVG